MAPQRKRKHAATEEDPAQQGIKAFGYIGKATEAVTSQKKQKTAQHGQPCPAPRQTTASQNKRKRSLSEQDAVPTLADTPLDEDSNSDQITAPRTKRIKAARPTTLLDTPSKRTADLFRNLKLDKQPAPIPFSLGSTRPAYDTPPDTPDPSQGIEPSHPQAIDDLLSLHAAFLSALSLYYAHNGVSSSVNVEDLLPLITKSWRKRAVSLEDLRIVLAVDEDGDSDFQLKEFGRAGIRLVKQHSRGRPTKLAATYVDENELNSRFEGKLLKSWESWKASSQEKNLDPEAFIDQLPLASIEKDVSVGKAAPVFARGQQRLADIRASQAATKQDTTTTNPPTTIEQRATGSVQNRGTNLLDRIIAKQAISATLPAGPTRDQLERKAALQRIEDVSRVLDLLTAGRTRCSFSLQAIVQQIQQSLRNPMSKADVERCLELMAAEITPAFVSLLRNGSVTGVVITKGGKVVSEELKRRVQAACDVI